MNWFLRLSSPVQGLIATLFTWALTAFGASPVFLVKKSTDRLLCAMGGLASGVMLAASYFSLLAPALVSADAQVLPAWLMLGAGFFLGGIGIYLVDALMQRRAETQKSNFLLILSMTLHNIPEGMAVGVAFGAGDPASACLLALGIGLQNLPEGSAISLPLCSGGYSRGKAFFVGQLTGAVEPVFGFLGALLVAQCMPLMPFFLSFASGAMIYVVISELIPESHGISRTVSSFFTILGFLIMMLLDVALG